MTQTPRTTIDIQSNNSSCFPYSRDSENQVNKHLSVTDSPCSVTLELPSSPVSSPNHLPSTTDQVLLKITQMSYNLANKLTIRIISHDVHQSLIFCMILLPRVPPSTPPHLPKSIGIPSSWPTPLDDSHQTMVDESSRHSNPEPCPDVRRYMLPRRSRGRFQRLAKYFSSPQPSPKQQSNQKPPQAISTNSSPTVPLCVHLVLL